MLTSGVTLFGGLGANRYGDVPFAARTDTRPIGRNLHEDVCVFPVPDRIAEDFTKPVTTPGADPADANQYDYWHHLEFFIQETGRRQIYVALNPVVSTCYVRYGHVTKENAEAVGRIWGSRFGAYRATGASISTAIKSMKE